MGKPIHQYLATGQIIDKRFHSAPVLRLTDAKPMQSGHVAEADGRWRIYAFTDRSDTGHCSGAVHQLCDFLDGPMDSPVRRYTRQGEDIAALIDIRAIFQQGFTSMNYVEMHALLRPAKGSSGLRDFAKVFCVDHKSGHDIYDMRGINHKNGCIFGRSAGPVCVSRSATQFLFGPLRILQRNIEGRLRQKAPAARQRL